MPKGPPSGRARAAARVVAAAAREGRAFVQLAMLLPLDLRAAVPRSVGEGADVVVLVHGSLATAGVWRPLRAELEASGSRTASFTYGLGRGVPEIADAIRAVVEGLPGRVRIHLVGHSLGGLAVRWFVQETPGDRRVVQTISVAAPFGGARGARLLPGRAGRDMRRGSAVLLRLAASAARPSVPHLSIFGAADTAVPADTAFPVGARILVPDAGHNALLFDAGVAGRILERVRSGGG